MAIKNENFFESQTASSRIKANIVAEYFPQYARILLSRNQRAIRYMDLFAGPGMYRDGNFSTPLLIAKACADDPRLANKVQLYFNDKYFSGELEANFKEHFPLETFNFKPEFRGFTVGESEEIQKYLMKESTSVSNRYPTLLFVDPWGYKGIDTVALSKFLCHWGNEIFLFVNIKRINAALENEKFEDVLRYIFPTTFDGVKKDSRLEAISVHERTSFILRHLADEFKKQLALYVKDPLYHCSFKFQEEDSVATSHYIIHFCKHPKGFELIKQVYHDFDNIGATLVNSNTYTFDAKKMYEPAGTSFDFGDMNVAHLSDQLSREYQGLKINAKQVYDEHHTKYNFSVRHYLKALRDMEEKGKIIAKFNDNVNRKVSVLLIKECILEFK